MINKELKNLKIYHADHFSYKKLKSKPFFFFINRTGQYKHTLLEALVNIVRDFNPHEKIDKIDLTISIEEYIDLAEVSNHIEVPAEYRNTFISKFIDAYYLKDYIDIFRGDALEFLMFYLENKSFNKLYHEPHFYNKRKRIPTKKFKGQNCLIDVVEQFKSKSYIKLIECKANLDNNIHSLKYKDKFRKKLALMDALEEELLDYVDCDDNKMRVEKGLASIISPRITLPTNYKNYKIIDLYDLFRMKEKMN